MLATGRRATDIMSHFELGAHASVSSCNRIRVFVFDCQSDKATPVPVFFATILAVHIHARHACAGRPEHQRLSSAGGSGRTAVPSRWLVPRGMRRPTLVASAGCSATAAKWVCSASRLRTTIARNVPASSDKSPTSSAAGPRYNRKRLNLPAH